MFSNIVGQVHQPLGLAVTVNVICREGQANDNSDVSREGRGKEGRKAGIVHDLVALGSSR
jgi:hypothetical protein